MTRLTGTDAWGLMEAYNAVYAPQEITEEQIWEEVELWVNSLVEEGYDLSEYTWDELHNYYIEEGFKKMNRGKISKQINKDYKDKKISDRIYTKFTDCFDDIDGVCKKDPKFEIVLKFERAFIEFYDNIQK